MSCLYYRHQQGSRNKGKDDKIMFFGWGRRIAGRGVGGQECDGGGSRRCRGGGFQGVDFLNIIRVGTIHTPVGNHCERIRGCKIGCGFIKGGSFDLSNLYFDRGKQWSRGGGRRRFMY